MDKKHIEDTMRAIIIKRLRNVQPEAITVDTELVSLGIDSLSLGWVLADMEDAFEFTISMSDIIKLKTVADTIDYVERRVAK